MTRFFLVNIISFTILSFFHTVVPIIGRNILHISNTQIGLIIAIAIAASMIIRVQLGHFIDLHGTKSTVITGVVLGVIGVLLFALKINYYIYLAASIIFGSGSYLIIISTLIGLSKSIKHKRYVSVFGKFGISFFIPIFYAPALALFFFTKNIRWIMYLSAALYLLVPFIFPFTKVEPDNNTIAVKKRYFNIHFPVLLIFPITLFDGALWTFFILFLMNNFSESKVISLGSRFFIVLSIVVILTNAFLSRRKGAYGQKHLYKYIIIGMVLIIISGLLIISKNHIAFLFVPLFYGVGFAFEDIFTLTLVVSSYPRFNEGTALSVYSIFFDLGWIAGSLGLGVIADNFGYISMYEIAILFVFLDFAVALINYIKR